MSKGQKRLTGVFLMLVLLFFFKNQTAEFGSKITNKIFSKNAEFYLPAEFEEQEAVWMSSDDSSAFRPVRAGIIRELLPYVRLNIVAQSESSLKECRDYLKSVYIDVSKINFQIMQGSEFWIRDHGATFMINKEGGMAAVDFGWSRYGYDKWLDEYYQGDSAMIESVIKTLPFSETSKVDSLMGASLGVPIIKSWVNIEGGSLEVNGKGTLILNEPLTLGRNKGASKEQIEEEFKKVLNVKNVIWVQDGLAEDPLVAENIVDDYVAIGTGGHTDEYIRFADPNTILLAWVPEEEKDLNPINRINHERMKKNYEILLHSRDQDGRPFTIIKVPLPNPIVTRIKLNEKDQWDGTLNIPEWLLKPGTPWKAGDSLSRLATASYLNYFVTNKVVLLPTYLHAGTSQAKESTVKQIFREAFPDRSIIFMNALPLNWRGGGMHCAIQQQPNRRLNP
jgi:agmatine deiminase